MHEQEWWERLAFVRARREPAELAAAQPPADVVADAEPPADVADAVADGAVVPEEPVEWIRMVEPCRDAPPPMFVPLPRFVAWNWRRFQ